jgi:hypothetical protein
VHEDGIVGFPAENEREAKDFAKYKLCTDYEKKRPGEENAELKCSRRPAEDFTITCTSTVRVATLHAGGCTKM